MKHTMKKNTIFLLAVLLAVLLASCAAKPEKASVPVSPPVTTGAVRLVFESALGGGTLNPQGLSFGAEGSLYVCDRDSRSVLRMDGKGAVVSRFGGFESRAERMFSPVDVAAGDGVDVFALDGVNSRVLRLDRGLREPSTVYGGTGTAGNRFGVFNGIALDPETGDLFLTDGSNGAIVRLDRNGNTPRVMGGFGTDRLGLRDPAGLDMDSRGVLLVADRGRGAVAVISRSGADIRYLGENVLESPVDVAALPDNRLAIADRRGVVILTREGVAEASAGYGVDREITPRAVAFREGKLFVSDARSGSILVYRMVSGDK